MSSSSRSLAFSQPDYTSNSTHPAQYWSGNSSYGLVVALLNPLDTPATLGFNLTESWLFRAGIEYTVRDLWTHTNNGTVVREYNATVP